MRLVEEKRALAEVSDLKRSRKAFDSFDSAQGSIDADKAKIDELKSTLDNPEYKALNDRYEAIQVELDELNKELEAGNRSRDSLYDERNKLNQDVNALWSRKKESAGNFKEANDRYCKRDRILAVYLSYDIRSADATFYVAIIHSHKGQ